MPAQVWDSPQENRNSNHWVGWKHEAYSNSGSIGVLLPHGETSITEKPRRSTRNRSLWSVDGLYEIVGGLGKKLDLGEGFEGKSLVDGGLCGMGRRGTLGKWRGRCIKGGEYQMSMGCCMWIRLYRRRGIRIRQTLEGKSQWTGKSAWKENVWRSSVYR